MGWSLTSGGGQVIPVDLGTWIVVEGDSGKWPLEGYHDSGDWQVTGYNLGNQPHSIYMHFELSYIRPRETPVQLLAASLLAPVPDLRHAGPPVHRR